MGAYIVPYAGRAQELGGIVCTMFQTMTPLMGVEMCAGFGYNAAIRRIGCGG
jgi:hypothetical protein